MERDGLAIPGTWFPGIYEATKDQARLLDVDILSSLTRDEFVERYAKRSIPFLLRGAESGPSESEILSKLSTSLGDQKVSVRFGDMSEPGRYLNRRTEEMALREFLAQHFFETGEEDIAYAGSSNVPESFVRELGFAFPSFYPEEFYVEPRLWLGREGTVTPLHKDIPDNFAHACFGTKEWVIYPPRDYPYLYMTNPTPDTYPDFGASQVNLGKPDLEAFPEFRKAEGIGFTMRAGDVLYLPAGWSHCVKNTSASLMINFWLKREKSPAVLGCDRE